MTTYTAITNGQVDADSPVDAPLMQALRDNPLSIQEMADSAPPLQGEWHPYDMSTIGDGTDGEIWSHAADGTVNTVVSPDFDDGYEYLFYFKGITNASGSRNWTVEFYEETTGAYTITSVFNATGPATAQYIFFRTAAVRSGDFAQAGFLHAIEFGYANTGTPTDVSQALTTAEKVTRVRLKSQGGNWTGGAIYMLRRRTLTLDI
jgi:hypothetical protein